MSLRRFLATLTLCFGLNQIEARASTLAVVNPRGAIGEMGAMGVWQPGAHISIENDWIGGTDKLVTATASIDLNTLSETGYSLGLGYRWRLVTPVEETRFGQPSLALPIGPFIDWEEYSGAMAKTAWFSWGGVKLQIFASYHMMRDNFGKNVLRGAHNLIGTGHNNFGSSLRSWHWGGGGEVDILSKPFQIKPLGEFEALVGVGWSQSEFVHEVYLRAQVIVGANETIRLALEGLVSGHAFSPIYGGLLGKRHFEAGVAATLNPYWRSGVRYVSPYLEGDRFGQWYVEIVGINIPFR